MHTQPTPQDFTLGPPEYFNIIKRYEGLDPALVRLTSEETAQLTGLAKKTLEARRTQGRGPAFLKLGRRVEYRLSDIMAFMEGSVFVSTREAKVRTGGAQ